MTEEYTDEQWAEMDKLADIDYLRKEHKIKCEKCKFYDICKVYQEVYNIYLNCLKNCSFFLWKLDGD